MLVSDIVHARFFGAKHAIHLSKIVRYLYKQTTLSRVVRFKQTTVISNIRQLEFDSL